MANKLDLSIGQQTTIPMSNGGESIPSATRLAPVILG